MHSIGDKQAGIQTGQDQLVPFNRKGWVEHYKGAAGLDDPQKGDHGRYIISEIKRNWGAGKPHCESIELFELGVICK